MKIFGKKISFGSIKNITIKKGYQMIFFLILIVIYVSIFWNMIYWFTYQDIMKWNPIVVVYVDSIAMILIFTIFAADKFYGTWKGYTEEQKKKIHDQYAKRVDGLDKELKKIQEKDKK